MSRESRYTLVSRHDGKGPNEFARHPPKVEAGLFVDRANKSGARGKSKKRVARQSYRPKYFLMIFMSAGFIFPALRVRLR